MRIALVLVAAVACGQTHPKGVGKMGGADAEVETQIMLLQSPFGDPQHVRERERAAQWLVAHADQAYQRLLAMAQDGTAGPAVVEILPEFGRPESVPVLEALLEGPERTAWAAGQALARHSGPDAPVALRRAVRGSRPDTVAAAADGLAARGEKTACADLTAAIRHADDRARYHTIQAAARLGCLSRQQLEEIVTRDPSPDIRALAAGVLGREP